MTSGGNTSAKNSTRSPSTDPRPLIVTQPTSQTITAGQTATFSISAAGTAPLSYLWKKNGTIISGATSSSYTTPAEATSDNGVRFTIVVSNSAGSATSSAAILTVNAAPAIAPLQIAATALPNAEVGLQFQTGLSATGGVQPYHWSVASRTFPAALSLNPSTGALSGMPSQQGQFDFSVQVSDSSLPQPQTVMKPLVLTVVLALQIASGVLPNGQVGVPFQALLSGSGGVAPYSWTVTDALPSALNLNASSGAITGTPTAAGTSTFTVVLTDSAGQTAQKPSSVTIAPAVQPLAITTTSLPQAVTGQAYSATLQATGGAPPYTWIVTSGQLPSGLTLSSANGQIVGISSQAVSSTVSIQATDSTGQTAQKSLGLTTAPVGPILPTLPQAKVDVTMPAQTGTVRNVTAGSASDLQAKINAATCGDTIVVPANNTYTGNFTIPKTNCSGWILLETSALSSLPPSGTRVSGACSPGIPPATVCPPPSAATIASMATLISSNAENPTISFQTGAHNWRLIGLEVTQAAGLHDFALIETDNNAKTLANLVSYVIIDRCYVHGTASGAVRRGVSFQVANGAIIDSDLREIHDQNFPPGTGSDSQAIGAWTSPGPMLIRNNFLSAASENIMFGGAPSSITNLIPSDITIEGNHYWKDYAAWYGSSYDEKNIQEFKCAQRVMMDGNVLEFSWVDGQVGYGILITPRADGSPLCTANDITITHNLIQHAANGIETAPSDDSAPSLPTNRVLIQNNVIGADVGDPAFGSGIGISFEALSVNSAGMTTQNNLTIDHNTALGQYDFIQLGDNGNIPTSQVTNNIGAYGAYGIIGTGFGIGNSSVNSFLPNVLWNDDVILTPGGTNPDAPWPTGTIFNSPSGTGFTNYSGGNYQLLSGSAYHNAGTDGRDIGVWDWTTFSAETTNALNGNYP